MVLSFPLINCPRAKSKVLSQIYTFVWSQNQLLQLKSSWIVNSKNTFFLNDPVYFVDEKTDIWGSFHISIIALLILLNFFNIKSKSFSYEPQYIEQKNIDYTV